MSYVTGTQMECLYAMPATGPTVTAAAATICSGTTAANPPFGLDPNFFAQRSGNGPGKTLIIEGGGRYTVGSTAVTDIFKIGLNTTQNTAAIAVTLGATGAWTTVASQTDVDFFFHLVATLTVVGKAGTNCSVNAVGYVLIGQGNNAANPTLQTVGAQWATPIMIGAPQTAVAFDPTVTQYVEMSNQWSVTTGAPTMTLTNFCVFGAN